MALWGRNNCVENGARGFHEAEEGQRLELKGEGKVKVACVDLLDDF